MSKTQMNTRIDTLVKERGDKAFASIGWNPSQVVQAVWEVAAVDDTFPSLLKSIAEKPQQSAGLLQKQARMEEVVRGAHIVANAREDLGLPMPKKEKLDYKKMIEDAREMRLTEKGMQ